MLPAYGTQSVAELCAATVAHGAVTESMTTHDVRVKTATAAAWPLASPLAVANSTQEEQPVTNECKVVDLPSACVCWSASLEWSLAFLALISPPAEPTFSQQVQLMLLVTKHVRSRDGT